MSRSDQSNKTVTRITSHRFRCPRFGVRKRYANLRRSYRACEHLRSTCSVCNERNRSHRPIQNGQRISGRSCETRQQQVPRGWWATAPSLEARWYWHWPNNHVPIPYSLGLLSAHWLGKHGVATVLIVEDQAQILTLAQSFLEEQGHRTLSTATADDALAILTGPEAADALFVDIIRNGDMQAGIEFEPSN